MNARAALSSLLIAVVVVAVYHLVTSTEQGGPAERSADPRLARLAARVQALEDGARTAPSLSGQGADDRVARLERRLADLEAQAGHAGQVGQEGRTPAGLGPTTRAGDGSLDEPAAPTVLSEDAAARGNAILEAARTKARRENFERATSLFRERARGLDPNAAESDLDAAAALLAEHAQAVRELYEGKQSATAEEREELRRREMELHRQLQANLRSHLGDVAVSRLTQRETRRDR